MQKVLFILYMRQKCGENNDHTDQTFEQRRSARLYIILPVSPRLI